MYSTARKMALLSAIMSAVNIVGIILYLLASVTLQLAFSLSFAIFMILVSSSAVTLMLTLGMRSICQDLEYEYENTAKRLHEISSKIKEIENRA